MTPVCERVVGKMIGVARLHDVVYVFCRQPLIRIYGYNARTRKRLPHITNLDVILPWDVAACQQTSHLYVTDCREPCVWRVSPTGVPTRWWTRSRSDGFRPFTLSVTSSRVLVTSQLGNQLMQLNAGGHQLRRVRLPQHMIPHHAIESRTGTFIVSHHNAQQLSEVDREGRTLCQFSRGPSLGWPIHIAIDSEGNLFVADSDNRRILLLDPQLALRRVIIDKDQLNNGQPRRLCYNQQSAQLMVLLLDGRSVTVFDVLQR